MSIIGYRSENHPQQTARRGAVDDVDDRGTDPEFIAKLESRFGSFTLDVAAAAHNAKCVSYYDLAADGLHRPWVRSNGDPARVWCNPPYSDCGAWVRKAWDEWSEGNCDLIVMLLPANRVEQAWWQDFVEPFRDREGSPLKVEFLRGRMRFHRPGWAKPEKGDRPPFGCCLLIWEGES